jgi:glycerophosphoryl diester phosphodiesterase
MEFPKIMVVAHRGASGLAHENTIEAFQKAFEIGADCIELDIRKTKDGKIIVFHDRKIDGCEISSLLFAEVNSISRRLGFSVPTFEEALQYIRGKILVDIEFKEGGYEEEAVTLIHKYLQNHEFYVRSFYDEILIQIKKIDPAIRTALLLGFDAPKHIVRTRLSELFPRMRIRRTGCDFVSPHYRLLKFWYVKRMKSLGIPVCVWTVNDENLMEEILLHKKAASIVTNYPNIAIEMLKKAGLRQ